MEGHPAAAVTIRDLLSMDSGRQWSVLSDYVRLIVAADRTAYAIGLRQTAPPGRIWAYNNAAVQTLQRVLQKATGENVTTFAEQHLFAPLGMRHTTMTTDKAGNAQLFEGIHSTCLDLARFGVLMLDDGRSAEGRSSRELGRGRHRHARRQRSTPATATCGGSTIGACSPTRLTATSVAVGRELDRDARTARASAHRTTCTGRSVSATS